MYDINIPIEGAKLKGIEDTEKFNIPQIKITLELNSGMKYDIFGNKDYLVKILNSDFKVPLFKNLITLLNKVDPLYQYKDFNHAEAQNNNLKQYVQMKNYGVEKIYYGEQLLFDKDNENKMLETSILNSGEVFETVFDLDRSGLVYTDNPSKWIDWNYPIVKNLDPLVYTNAIRLKFEIHDNKTWMIAQKGSDVMYWEFGNVKNISKKNLEKFLNKAGDHRLYKNSREFLIPFNEIFELWKEVFISRLKFVWTQTKKEESKKELKPTIGNMFMWLFEMAKLNEKYKVLCETKTIIHTTVNNEYNNSYLHYDLKYGTEITKEELTKALGDHNIVIDEIVNERFI